MAVIVWEAPSILEGATPSISASLAIIIKGVDDALPKNADVRREHAHNPGAIRYTIRTKMEWMEGPDDIHRDCLVAVLNAICRGETSKHGLGPLEIDVECDDEISIVRSYKGIFTRITHNALYS